MDINHSPLSTHISGPEVKKLRTSLNLSQIAFWSPLGVTQSAGSRYESSQNIPAPILFMLHLVYLSSKPEDDLQAHKKAWALVE